MENNNLQIVFRIKDETTAGIESAKKNITGLQKTVQGSFSFIKDHLKEGALAASGFLASMGLMAKGMIDVTSNMEQWRMAFETMLGSADLAGKKLKELSDFAIKTPFDLPQVVEGAKRLLAYNVEADKLIPTFKMLGDIAAGVGREKLPNLILAFGQVKAATKLTGAELRQFSEAGVPLLQALVDQANETGGALTKVGGVSKETAKKIKSLASSIAQAEFDLNYFRQTGGKTEKQLKALEERIQKNKEQLASYGQVGQEAYTKIKVTAKDMIKQISEGNITIEQVETALRKMTEEGGRFYNLMDKQSKTFGGVMSNLRDEMVRFSMGVMGMTAEGEIRKGSIFYYLKIGAENALEAVNAVRPVVVDFIDNLLRNKEALAVIAGAIAGLFVLIGLAFLQLSGPALAVAGFFALVGGAMGFILEKASPLIYFINGVFTPVWNNFLKQLDQSRLYFELLGKNIEGFFIALFIVFGKFLIPLIGNFVLFFVVVTGVLSGIANAISGFVQMFAGLVQFFNGIWEIIKGIFTLNLNLILTGFYNTFMGIWNTVVGFLTAIYLFIEGFIKAVINIFISLYNALIGHSIIPDLVNGIFNWINKLVSNVTSWITTMKDNLISIVDNLKNNIISSFSTLKTKVVDFITGMARSIESILGGLASKAWSWGYNIIKNMINGLKNAIKSAGKLAGHLLGALGISMSDLDHYAGGGWVRETGPAIVHKGEYVLSKDMLAGRQPSILPAITNNYNRPISIQMNPVIHTQVDLDYLAYKLAYQLRNL